jgi:zinc D-Ala-D-Ala carboxypeptidase
MGNISEHISYNEATYSSTARQFNIKNAPNECQLANMKLVAEKVFEPLRKYMGQPIKVTSFFRSKKLNIKIGGSATSQHCEGKAMDLDTDNGRNKEMFDYIKDNLDFDQLIYEFGTDENPEWVHVSYSATGNRREVLRAKKVGFQTKYFFYK